MSWYKNTLFLAKDNVYQVKIWNKNLLQNRFKRKVIIHGIKFKFRTQST